MASWTVVVLSFLSMSGCYSSDKTSPTHETATCRSLRNCFKFCTKYQYFALQNSKCMCFCDVPNKTNCEKSDRVPIFSTLNIQSKSKCKLFKWYTRICSIQKYMYSALCMDTPNFNCVRINNHGCTSASETTTESTLFSFKQTATTKQETTATKHAPDSSATSNFPSTTYQHDTSSQWTSNRYTHHDMTTLRDNNLDRSSHQSILSSPFTVSTISDFPSKLKQTVTNSGPDEKVTIGVTVVCMMAVITGVIVAIYVCRRRASLKKEQESEYMQPEDHIIKTNGVSNANYIGDATLDVIRNSPARASTEHVYTVISEHENISREKTYADQIPVYHTLESAPKDKTNNPQTVIKAELASDYRTGDAGDNITVYHTLESAPNDKTNNHHADIKTILTDDSKMEDAGKGIPVYHTLDTDTSTGCKPPNTADANFLRDGNTIGTAAIYHVLENDVIFPSADENSVVDEYELAQSIPKKNGAGSGNRSDSDQIEMYHVLENSNQQMSGQTYELACIQQPGSNYEATGNDTSKEKDEECLDEDYCHLDHGDRVVSTARDSTYAHAHEECYDDGTYSHTTQGGHEVSTDLDTEYSYSHAGNGLDEDGDYSHMMDMNDI